jgi:hypothetical protein
MRPMGRKTALRVHRDKAALSSGCKPHPATAPAGSNRSSHVLKAFLRCPVQLSLPGLIRVRVAVESLPADARPRDRRLR